MIGFGFILAFAGIILVLAGAGQAAQNYSFRDARKTTGKVIYKHSRKTKNGQAYLLKLAYSVDGLEYEREVGVQRTEYENIEVGDRYKVLYRPDKPKKILREQDTNPKIVKVFLILGAGLIVAGIALLFIIRLVNM